MVQVTIAPGLVAQGDPGQLRTALEQLEAQLQANEGGVLHGWTRSRPCATNDFPMKPLHLTPLLLTLVGCVASPLAPIAVWEGAPPAETLTLKPGKYLLYCNLPGHYIAGMWTVIDVAP